MVTGPANIPPPALIAIVFVEIIHLDNESIHTYTFCPVLRSGTNMIASYDHTIILNLASEI